MDTKSLATVKVKRALALIDKARELLSEACGELSPIVYADKEWEKVGNHYDSTKALWHSVNDNIQWSKIDLDSDAKEKVLRMLAEDK